MTKKDLARSLHYAERNIDRLCENYKILHDAYVDLSIEYEVLKKSLIQVFGSRFGIDLSKQKTYKITLSAKDKERPDITDYFIGNNILDVYKCLIVSPDYEIKDIKLYEECNP